jgi:hypothetical protein
MNGASSGYGDYKHPTKDGYLKTYRDSQFPADAIILWEVDDDSGWWNDCANYPREGITKRHRDGATVGLINGATEWLTYEDFYKEEENEPGRLWCNPGEEDGR